MNPIVFMMMMLLVNGHSNSQALAAPRASTYSNLGVQQVVNSPTAFFGRSGIFAGTTAVNSRSGISSTYSICSQSRMFGGGSLFGCPS